MININHHLSDPLFAWRYASVIGDEAKLSPDRRLNARTIECFPFDLRSRDGFAADRFNRKLAAFFASEVFDTSENNASSNEELLFGFHKSSAVPNEIRPVFLLPVPVHE